MDDKLFDKIIKEKAESYVDMSRPSGAEMSRLFEQLPPTSGGSWFSSTTNRVVSVVATALVILTIFLIYRTFRLEETIELLDERLQESTVSGDRIIYQYDTLAIDSLSKLSIRLNRKMDSLLSSQAGLMQVPVQASTDAIDLDTEAMASAVMEQLLAEIQSDPALMDQIREQLGMNQTKNEEDGEAEEPPDDSPVSSTRIAELLVKEDQADDILIDLAEDPDQRKVISNLLMGNDPEDEDALGMNLSEETIKSLSPEKKEQLLKEFLEHDPSAVAESVESSNTSEQTNELLQEYMAATPLEPKKMDEADSVRRVARLNELEEIRDEQEKVRNRAILLGGGLGIGRLPLEGFESAGTTSFKLTGEYQPNRRFGFATGLEYYWSEAETYHVGSIDLTQFDDIDTDDDEIDEVKVNLQWLDIPLEAKLYIKRGKFSPYAIVSIRARTLLKESYTFEGDDEEYSSSSFESGNTFLIPSYGYGVGTQFYLNPKLKGAIQLHHSIGGKGLGLNDQQLNTIQLQGIIYFDLK